MIQPQRILIIKPSSLGDVATALPLLCDLRRAYPNAVIDWLIAPAFAALVEGHDALNNIIIFDRKELASWWYSPAAFRNFSQLKRRLNSGNYDCVIDAQGLLRSGYFSWVTGAKTRIGFADAREGGSLFYTHRVPLRRREALAVIRMGALLDPLGIPHDHSPEYRVPINPQAAAKMQTLVPENAIGFIPGCRGKGKRWPAKGFAWVIANVSQGRGRPVLFGTPDERELCDEIVTLSRDFGLEAEAVNLAGRTSVAEMVAALNRCKLVIGNDTGPLHVAAALGKRVIGLYGRTDPKSVGPYGDFNSVSVVRFNVHKNWEETVKEVYCLTQDPM